MLLHQGLRSESIFQNSGVCLLLPICAIAWDTNLEVLELDLISVSHEEGTEPEFSLWGSGIPSGTRASDPGAFCRALGVLHRRAEVGLTEAVSPALRHALCLTMCPWPYTATKAFPRGNSETPNGLSDS